MRLTYLKLVATVFFWGTNFAAGKLAVQSLGPYTTAFLRFTVGAVLLILILFRTHGYFPKLTKNQWGLVLVSAVTGILLYNALFFNGIQYLPTVRASLVIAFAPISISLGNWLIFNEKVSILRWLGILISIVGAATVLTHGNFSAFFSGTTWGIGELLIAGCVLSWTLYTLIGKVALRTIPAMSLSAYSALIGAALLLIPAMQQGLPERLSQASVQALASVIYMGSTATALGFIWYYEAVQKIGATKAAVVGNLTPVFAALIAITLLGEELSQSTVIGGTLVLIGVWLTARK
ncbi:MAG: EamA family transporter [Spirosomataceae bacterium]